MHIHQIAETIRSKNTKIDKLLSTVKNIFLKAPIRTIMFKKMYPE